MTPRPETNLLICHGVLAPRARWRRRAVAYGRAVPDPTTASGSAAALAPAPDGVGEQPKPRAWGRLRLIATLHDPAVIRKILAHLGIANSGPSPGPAPPNPSAAAP